MRAWIHARLPHLWRMVVDKDGWECVERGCKAFVKTDVLFLAIGPRAWEGSGRREVQGVWRDLLKLEPRRMSEELIERLPDAVPGFPSQVELLEWALTQPRRHVIGAAIDVLGHDPVFAHQYAAMGLLRALDVDVEGSAYGGRGYGDDFRWVVRRWRTRTIKPAGK